MATLETRVVPLFNGKKVTLFAGSGDGIHRLDFEGRKVWERDMSTRNGAVYFVSLRLVGPNSRLRIRYVLARVVVAQYGRKFVRGVREISPRNGEIIDHCDGLERFYSTRAAIEMSLYRDDGRVAYDRIEDHERDRSEAISCGRARVTVNFTRLGTHWGNTSEVVESIFGHCGLIWSYRISVHEGRHFYLLRLGGGNTGLPYFNAVFVETAGAGENEVVVDVGVLNADRIDEFAQHDTTVLYMEAAAKKLGIAVNSDPSIMPLAFTEVVDTSTKHNVVSSAEHFDLGRAVFENLRRGDDEQLH